MTQPESLQFTREEVERLVRAARKYRLLAPRPYKRPPHLHDKDLSTFDDIVFRLDYFQSKKARQRDRQGNEIHENSLQALSDGIAARLVSKGEIEPRHLTESGLKQLLDNPVIKKKLAAASQDVELYLHLQKELYAFDVPDDDRHYCYLPSDAEEKIRRRFENRNQTSATIGDTPEDSAPMASAKPTRRKPLPLRARAGWALALAGAAAGGYNALCQPSASPPPNPPAQSAMGEKIPPQELITLLKDTIATAKILRDEKKIEFPEIYIEEIGWHSGGRQDFFLFMEQAKISIREKNYRSAQRELAWALEFVPEDAPSITDPLYRAQAALQPLIADREISAEATPSHERFLNRYEPPGPEPLLP